TPEVQGLRPQDVVVVSSAGSSPGERVFTDYYQVVREGDDDVLRNDAGQVFDVESGDPATTWVQLLTVDVMVQKPIIRPLNPERRYDDPDLFGGFSLDPADRRSIAAYFTERPASKRLQMSVPFAVVFDDDNNATTPTGIEFAQALFGDSALDDPQAVARVFLLEGGTDGAAPGESVYLGEGGDGSSPDEKSGLRALEAIEDISIVAAPGYSYGYVEAETTGQSTIRAIQQHLINHATRMRYRIAVLDAPDDATLGDVRAFRGQIDTKYGALYYPWVTVVNPIDGRELNVPPSGHVAGIYARNDVERGVQKAPANEIVRLAVGFEQLLSGAQQEVLNPEGVNCFRFFEGRGYRLWGARTATSDGEWKYVNLRRYFNYLERSIDKGTQVFVFESNGERLWENVRRTVYDFLLNEWKSGRLLGLKPEEAFFVKCDRTTMTQNDLDNGRLICLIGVAPLRPAEFVIFRIGQKLLETRG
ncbi:MAG TPA: phage tail sheath subtilisin-like domain-containing protein, partial [Rhodothermales bacterium]|nr:phage tail sheath subtilisin-like domain-containing protein [Rhodothermales bacterium]